MTDLVDAEMLARLEVNHRRKRDGHVVAEDGVDTVPGIG